MSTRNLTFLGALMVAIGLLPFLLMGLGMILSVSSGCGEVINGVADAACQHNDTETGGRIANLMFAAIYVPIAVPIGAVGVILLVVARRRQKG